MVDLTFGNQGRRDDNEIEKQSCSKSTEDVPNEESNKERKTNKKKKKRLRSIQMNSKYINNSNNNFKNQ